MFLQTRELGICELAVSQEMGHTLHRRLHNCGLLEYCSPSACQRRSLIVLTSSSGMITFKRGSSSTGLIRNLAALNPYSVSLAEGI